MKKKIVTIKFQEILKIWKELFWLQEASQSVAVDKMGFGQVEQHWTLNKHMDKLSVLDCTTNRCQMENNLNFVVNGRGSQFF